MVGKTGNRTAKLMTGVGALAMFLGAFLVLAPSADANHNPNAPEDHGGGNPNDSETRRVQICHATGSETNPYVRITVDFNAQDGTFGNGANDHTGHANDVLPITEADKAFIANNCSPPETTTDPDPDGPGPVTVDPTPEASLQIVKVATGDVPDSWTADFTGGLGDFTLRSDSSSTTEDRLEPGPYTVTEVASDDYDLESVVCDGGAVVQVDGGVTVTLADEDDVTCTFTNDYPEEAVLGEETVRPTPPGAPPVDPGTPPAATPPAGPQHEVLGEAVQRSTTLPRTGDGNRHLAGLGLLVLGAGLLLTGTSRRRQPAHLA